ncbi:hypothetical protein ACOSQ3_016339 [Xanthoceras sorbifolium]
MSSKKRGDTECCERNVIHGVVPFFYNGIEFKFDGDGDDEYILSIIENISKKQSQQALLNTNMDQLVERKNKAKAKKTKSELLENLFLDDFLGPRPFHVFLHQL